MKTDASGGNQPLTFFVLVFVLTVPLWLISALLGNKLPIPINLPISVFAFVVPAIAASILTYRRFGLEGVKALLKKAFDYKKIENKTWYLPALLLAPSIYVLSYAVMRLTGRPLPDPIEIPILLAPVFFVAFFIGAACEELGWSGYAVDPLQSRWGALTASIIIGLVWGVWHVIGHLQAGSTADWIVWHRLYSVALRVLMVWIYNNTGKSVFAAILVHAMDNVSVFSFPNYGSHYDPIINSVIAWPIVAIVLLGWEPKTFARYRRARASRS